MPIKHTILSSIAFWAVTIAATGAAHAQTTTAAGARACLYNSRSYSDGAYLCAQKSLMLRCSDDGSRASWTIVAEKSIADRCVAPLAQDAAPRRSRRAHYVRFSRSAPVIATPASAKCFTFNGRRYCE